MKKLKTYYVPLLFKKVREEKVLTQEQLARILGVKRSALSKYENGTRTPGIDLVYKLKEMLGYAPDTPYNEIVYLRI